LPGIAGLCLALSCAVPVSGSAYAADSYAASADTAGFFTAAGSARYTLDPDSRDVVRLKSWRLKHGDDSAWARPEAPDADWQVAHAHGAFWAPDGLPDPGIGGHRARLRSEPRSGPPDPLAMPVRHYPSAEGFYGQGILIAGDGRKGMTAGEGR